MGDLTDTIAGAIGGAVCIYVGLPLDTIKVRLQTKGFLFQGSIDCALQTVRCEGFAAFFKGALPALSSGMIENTVVFTANGFLYKIFVQEEEKPSFFKQCALNGASAIFSGLCITPAECIKCRLQSSLGYSTEDSHFTSVMQQLYTKEGITGFSRGLVATWMRDIPFYMIFFGCYTQYKSYISKRYYGDEKSIHPIHYVIGGGIAGSISWFSVFPADAIKSQQQTQMERLSFIQTYKQMTRTYGYSGLYKGCWPAVILGFPSSGALLLAVEITKSVLHYLGLTSGRSLGSYCQI